jgi:phosphate transport system substrate-binding protein
MEIWMKYIIGLLLAATLTTPALARDEIRVVGSSTVYPFTTTVAEQFAKKNGVKTPVVESTGTGGGIKLFCAGVGEDTPDAVNASRPIKDTEIDTCTTNGVTPIQVELGYDAIVVAHAKGDLDYELSLNELYLALAEWIIVVREDNSLGFEKNPRTHWNVNRRDNVKIEVLGPPPTSGTRDSFVELVMVPACKASIKEAGLTISEEDEKKYCHSIRSDGAYIEAGENDNLIVQKLLSNPNAFGIFGYSFLEQNAATLDAASIDNVFPEYNTVSEGRYPISRKLYVYFKAEHMETVSNLVEFLQEFVSDEAAGEEGYLMDKGLIPLHPDDHEIQKQMLIK